VPHEAEIVGHLPTAPPHPEGLRGALDRLPVPPAPDPLPRGVRLFPVVVPVVRHHRRASPGEVGRPPHQGKRHAGERSARHLERRRPRHQGIPEGRQLEEQVGVAAEDGLPRGGARAVQRPGVAPQPRPRQSQGLAGQEIQLAGPGQPVGLENGRAAWLGRRKQPVDVGHGQQARQEGLGGKGQGQEPAEQLPDGQGILRAPGFGPEPEELALGRQGSGRTVRQPGIDPPGESAEERLPVRAQQGELPPRYGIHPEAPVEPVDLQQAGSGGVHPAGAKRAIAHDLRQPASRQPPHGLHLPESVLRHDDPEPAAEIGKALGLDAGDATVVPPDADVAMERGNRQRLPHPGRPPGSPGQPPPACATQERRQITGCRDVHRRARSPPTRLTAFRNGNLLKPLRSLCDLFRNFTRWSGGLTPRGPA
jgi:hypothetical protein